MTSSTVHFSEGVSEFLESWRRSDEELQNAIVALEFRLATLESQRGSQTLVEDVRQLQNDVESLKAKDKRSEGQGITIGDSQEKLSDLPRGENTDTGSTDVDFSVQSQSYKQLANKRQYEFQMSVYDAALFIGKDYLTPLCSVLACLSFILNMVMQLGVVILISREFTDEPFPTDTVDRLRYWRSAEGHSYTRADPVSGQSLVARVCNNDPALSMAASQVSYHTQVLGYTDRGNGYFLCNASVLRWAFCCCVELRMTMKLVSGFLILPKHRHKSIVTLFEDSIQLVLVSHGRLLLVFFVAVCRGIIAILLMYYGTIWLAYTDNVEGLLLNASALGFVLDIDETIFRLFAPSLLAGVIRSLRPIRLPPSRVSELIQLCFVICIAGLLLVMNVIYLRPVTASMNDVEQVLCAEDSNLDFIVGINALGWLLYVKSPPFEAESTDMSGTSGFGSTARSEAVQLLIDKDAQASTFAVDESQNDVRKNLVHLTSAVGRSLKELTKEKPCLDFKYESARGVRLGPLLYSATHEPLFRQIETCEEIAAYCRGDRLSLVSQNVRFLCPVTCGCADPLSGLWDLAAPEAGCPRDNCDTQMAQIRTTDYRCKDMNLEQLNTTTWTSMLARMQQGNTFEMTVFNNLTSMGCEALINLDTRMRGSLCAHSNSFLGAGMMCPVACGCLQGSRFHLGKQVDSRLSISCPSSCDDLYNCVVGGQNVNCPASCEETLALDHFECSPTCNETLSGTGDIGYRGCQNFTRSGRLCQTWTSFEPHMHHYWHPPDHPGFGLGYHNYCRNPDMAQTIWCFTTDPDVQWDYCDPVGFSTTTSTMYIR